MKMNDLFGEVMREIEIESDDEVKITEEDIKESAEAEIVPAAVPSVTEYYYDEKPVGETQKRGTFWRNIIAAVLVVAIGGGTVGSAIGFGIGLGQGLAMPRNEGQTVTAEPFRFADIERPDVRIPVVTKDGPNEAEPLSFASLVELVEPSVVTIVARGRSSSRGFFGNEIPSEGAGSGILFYEDGQRIFIVTNNHVVADAETVEVHIGMAGPFQAALVGRRETMDIAVITIRSADVAAAGIKNIRIANFGDSDALRVGDVVLAIGNAMGEGNTATNGIISAKNKSVTIDNIRYIALQTNAAINPGNSGGPLVNIFGEVIGINSAKLANSGSIISSGLVEGMGYAIPSNDIMAIIEDLMDPKPILGITGQTLRESVAEQYDLPAAGVYVSTVMEGYPAYKAGLKPHDIITSLNDKTILTFDDLREVVGSLRSGDKAEIKIIRGGTEFLSFTVEMFVVDNPGF
jgi:serine protease Do